MLAASALFDPASESDFEVGHSPRPADIGPDVLVFGHSCCIDGDSPRFRGVAALCPQLVPVSRAHAVCRAHVPVLCDDRFAGDEARRVRSAYLIAISTRTHRFDSRLI
jgi:hypothetical protein